MVPPERLLVYRKIPRLYRGCAPRHWHHGTTRRRADEAGKESLLRLRAAFPDLEVIPVSVIDEASLDAFREAAWRLTGLIRVRLRSMGETNPEIAGALGLSRNTVKTYLQRTLEKLGARNRVEALARANQLGIL